MTREDVAGAAAEVCRIDVAANSLDTVLSAVAGVVLDAVTDARSAGVVVLDHRGSATHGGSSAVAHVLDGFQLFRQEGPVVSALRGQGHASADLGDDPRWPALRSAQSAQLECSVIAAPLLQQQRVFGAISMYGDPGALSAAGLFGAGQLANVCAATVSAAAVLATAEERCRNLEAAMAGRAVIEQAKGVLMQQYGLTARAAFDQLRELSQTAHVKLGAVAAQIVAGASERISPHQVDGRVAAGALRSAGR